MALDEKKFIGHKIKLFRKRQSLTQAELAEKIGISEKHISKIELGVYSPTLSNFVKILNVLNLGLDEFGFTNNSEKSTARNQLLELIYESSENEIEYYLDVIKSSKKLITKSKLG